MLKVRLTEAAERDLADIEDFLAVEASDTVADRVVSEIITAAQNLCRFPLAGSVRPNLARDVRVIFHGSYGVYYRNLDDAIVVLRVLHGARDVAALAKRVGIG